MMSDAQLNIPSVSLLIPPDFSHAKPKVSSDKHNVHLFAFVCIYYYRFRCWNEFLSGFLLVASDIVWQ